MLRATRPLLELSRNAARATPVISVPKIGSYSLFLKEEARKETGLNKENFPRFSKNVSTKWSAMTAAQKEEYQKRSKEINEKALAEFHKKPESEQQKLEEVAREAKKALARKRELRERREHWESTGHPKLPANSFILFSKDRRAEMEKSGTKVTSVEQAKAVVQEIAKEWKSLPDNLKAKWITAADEEHKKYKEALAKWERKENASTGAVAKNK